MEIRFRTRKLQRQYEVSAIGTKAYGAQVARKYIERVNVIRHVRDVEELRRLPGLKCHALTGDRAGQWAVKLTGFYRLLFRLEGTHLEIVLVEEVSKHYDD